LFRALQHIGTMFPFLIIVVDRDRIFGQDLL
jgi:hypothetical protein